jgi:hypothetical protein
MWDFIVAKGWPAPMGRGPGHGNKPKIYSPEIMYNFKGICRVLIYIQGLLLHKKEHLLI